MSKEKILKAGAIILSKENKRNVVLLFRGKHNDWSFPKGHIEEGEDAVQTMIREMKEETGLNIQILRNLPDIEYSYRDGTTISTKMFLVNSLDDSLLKLEFDTDKIMWVDYMSVVDQVSYDNLKEYFKLITPILEEVIVAK